jgi:hypothetical protein
MSAAPATTVDEAETTAEHEPDVVQRYVNDIFGKVIYHDLEIERLAREIETYVQTGERPSRSMGPALSPADEVDDLLGDFRSEVKWLCAMIAPVAVRRATAIADATAGEYGQVIFDMSGEKSRSYAFGLFAEAGIPERFME